MGVFEKGASSMKRTDGTDQEGKTSEAPQTQASWTLSNGTVENSVGAQDGNEASPQAQPPAPGPEAPDSRGSWGGKHEFLLSCVGYCVGLGNVWRFPYLCYRNGGGVFLIPYLIMMLVTGLPLFLMELSLGQYGGAGPITVWKCCPLLKGIGIGMLVVASLVSLYYNVIIAWTFYYLGSSFQNPLPWSCEAPANIQLCQNLTSNQSDLSASEVFWNEQVLGLTGSTGLGDPGPVRWQLAICLLAAWVFIFLCCLKGIRSSGKVWNDAASQIFYSLGIGFGGLLSMASYNKFDNNVVRDTLVIVTGNCITSFFAGFAIFSILGHMAWKKGVEVSDVADTGPGLAFVAYPEALALLPGSFIWSILFFLMLFTLGIDTLFGNLEGITTAFLDEFPVLRERKWKTIFLAVLCFSFYLLGLLLITEGGIYWFTLIDAYSTSFGLIIITLFMCLGIAFFYGVNQFCEDIIDMLRLCPPWYSRLLIYFKACWALFTPLLLLFILMYIFIEMYNTSLHYGTYDYPVWGKALGVCLGVVCCAQIPLWAVAAVVKESGTLRDRFQKAIRPLNSWKVTGGDRTFTLETIDVPFSVTLTDHDFTEV
ncbi:sodium-dependent proline transporter isoform X2 [Mobula birostris]|uniref:sodium-dependent proline transporter isoform X2 n=1 Tax=Mobula birostris TaxID=1983395 RepID=UPI003B27EA0F